MTQQGLTWTMNCLICGAEVKKLLNDGKTQEAKDKLSELTSEFTSIEIDYVITRLKEL